MSECGCRFEPRQVDDLDPPRLTSDLPGAACDSVPRGGGARGRRRSGAHAVHRQLVSYRCGRRARHERAGGGGAQKFVMARVCGQGKCDHGPPCSPFSVVFTMVLPYETVVYVWDLMLFHGVRVLFRAGAWASCCGDEGSAHANGRVEEADDLYLCNPVTRSHARGQVWRSLRCLKRNCWRRSGWRTWSAT